jgi:hypothetical protein
VYDNNIKDYSHIYKNFNDIFLIPHMTNRNCNFLKARGIESIVYDNFKLHSTFANIIKEGDEDLNAS